VSQWLEGSETRDTFSVPDKDSLNQVATPATLAKQYQASALTADNKEIQNLAMSELSKTKALMEEIKRKWA
jgi:hypothetical protein